MGCDIHLFVETRIDGQWHPKAPPPSKDFCDFGRVRWDFMRSGAAFDLMAGAGKDRTVTPLAEGRGIPADLSDEVRSFYDPDDVGEFLHTHFTLAELRTLSGKEGNIDRLIQRIDSVCAGLSDNDVRLIMWFDN